MSSNKKRFPLTLAGSIFFVVALLHLLRVVFNVEISVDKHILPMEVSYIGFVISLLLCIYMFKSRG